MKFGSLYRDSIKAVSLFSQYNLKCLSGICHLLNTETQYA